MIGVGLSINRVRGLSRAWSPADLFGPTDTGTWLEPFDLDTLFQDSAGTTPVTAAGQPVGQIADKSGRGNPATQVTSTARPTYRETPSRIDLDSVDDNMSINFGAAFAGSVLQGTPRGVLRYDVNVPSGAWALTTSPLYPPDGGEITGLIAVDRALTASEITNAEAYLRANGAGENFAGVTSMVQWFRGRTDVTAIYSGDWNTSSVTLFGAFAQGASSLTTLDVSNWDTSSVTRFDNFASGASSLTTLDVSNWNTSKVTLFGAFAQGASSLTTLDVSNWNTSSVTSFGAFALGASSLTTLDVSNWDTSSVTNFYAFALGARSLTTLDVSNWNTSSVTSFSSFARGASSLTTLDVSNWNTSSVTSFYAFANGASSLTTVIVNGGTGNPFADSPCTNYRDAFVGTNLTQQSIDDILVAINAAGTSGGTFNQSGGSAPSATGQTAITALRGRGWTVTVTGGF